ncbi:hypothetical protein CRUP_008470 [Coryphaenoides rupestris]|nr:hypothetical protein CRUP_008470 [Coryphaenoides rupestris]
MDLQFLRSMLAWTLLLAQVLGLAGGSLVTVNRGLRVKKGQAAFLQEGDLQFDIPRHGDSCKVEVVANEPITQRVGKLTPEETGYPVSRFLQKDLSHSLIYYRHLGNEVFQDSFEVVLSDFHDPPNLSEPQVVMVHIEPVPDQPPKEVPGAARRLVIKETEVVHLTRQHLHFVDPEAPDSQLTYTVTTPPFYTGSHRHSDAGRLFLVESVPKFTKDANAPMLRLFTQHVQFVLSITNHLGITVTGICFNITVLPVDNQPPQVRTNPLMVDEGGQCRLGPEHLLLMDVDSSLEDLRLLLRRGPRHGTLDLGGSPLAEGTPSACRTCGAGRYHHDGSETLEDVIQLTATDSTNPVDFELLVRPVNDEVPVVAAGLKAVLGCVEGRAAAITAEYLYATDADSDNGSLTYLIARQPYHGVVLRAGAIVDRFVQADITAGVVSYKHTGLEIGLEPRHDTITFVISDEDSGSAPPCCGGGGRGDIFVVDEGGTAPITTSHLKASDVDTALEELVISLVSPPQFGYIENVLPSPGFEKSNAGISIASFPYRDLLDGHVNYVQSRHQRMEPTADQFVLSVSDGARSSGHAPFHVIIRPANDEVPELLVRNITVREGGTRELDFLRPERGRPGRPQSELRFSLARPARHGTS